MHANNNHNKWTAAQLNYIIDSIRHSNNGKCSIRMVAERLRMSTWNAWRLLKDHGIYTNLYRESLDLINDEIAVENKTLTFNELYIKYGASWEKNSFYSYLDRNGIKFEHATDKLPSTPILKEFSENQNIYSTLTISEIAKIHGCKYKTAYRAVIRHSIPHTRSPKSPKPKVKA
jgi:hypothetical protein